MRKRTIISGVEIVRRVNHTRTILRSPRGASSDEIARRLNVSRQSALRLVDIVEQTEGRVLREREGLRVVFRLAASSRDEPSTMSEGEVLMLHFASRALAYLEGTGLESYLDAPLERAMASLNRKRVGRAQRLDRKIMVVDEPPMRYGDMAEIADEILSALLHETPLKLTYDSGRGKRKTFRFDPYTLLGYKRGLYVVGHNHHYNARKTLAFDAIIDAERIKGARFDYPDDYHPRDELGDAFGIIRGQRTDVHVRFDAKVARYVMRRIWHRTQKFVMGKDGYVHLSMRVDGTDELRNVLLSYGEFMEVIAPMALREEIAEAAAKMAARHTTDLPDLSGVDWGKANR